MTTTWGKVKGGTMTTIEKEKEEELASVANIEWLIYIEALDGVKAWMRRYVSPKRE